MGCEHWGENVCFRLLFLHLLTKHLLRHAPRNFMPKVHHLHVQCIQYHPRDGQTLLASSREANGIKLIDSRTYEEVKVINVG